MMTSPNRSGRWLVSTRRTFSRLRNSHEVDSSATINAVQAISFWSLGRNEVARNSGAVTKADAVNGLKRTPWNWSTDHHTSVSRSTTNTAAKNTPRLVKALGAATVISSVARPIPNMRRRCRMCSRSVRFDGIAVPTHDHQNGVKITQASTSPRQDTFSAKMSAICVTANTKTRS